LFIAGRVASVREGLLRAAAAVDSGDAMRTLDAMVRASHGAGEAGRETSARQAAGA
jgi:anthranilate phosphoribosyltransferase